MVRVMLRWCMSGQHSGYPFQYDVKETTTIGEIAALVLATNKDWWSKGYSGSNWSVVKICGPNNTFLSANTVIGGGHHQNECVLVFDAN
jgi:hypothetical protein